MPQMLPMYWFVLYICVVSVVLSMGYVWSTYYYTVEAVYSSQSSSSEFGWKDKWVVFLV